MSYFPSPRALASAASSRTENPGVWQYSSVPVIPNGRAAARLAFWAASVSFDGRTSQGSFSYETGGPRSSRFSS